MTQQNSSIIDLSQLPKPQAIELVDLNEIQTRLLTSFKTILEDNGYGHIFDALVVTDPAIAVLEAISGEAMVLYQRFNDAYAQGLLAFAAGTNLEHMGAPWNIERAITEYDDNGEAVTYQSDDDLRKLIQLAPEGLSTAGSALGYKFHALKSGRQIASVSLEQSDNDNELLLKYHFNEVNNHIKDANPILPLDENGVEMAGYVHVPILSYLNDGIPSDEQLAQVSKALNQKFVRPLTDHVVVMPARIKEYQINAKIYVSPGPDKAIIKSEAQTALEAFTNSRNYLQAVVSIAGIHDACHMSGVVRVELNIAGDIICDYDQAPLCTDMTLEVLDA